MRGAFRHLRCLGRVHFLLLLLARPGVAQSAQASPRQAPPTQAQSASAFPSADQAPPARPAPARPPVAPAQRPLPMPLFRPVALPAYRDFPPPPGYVEKVRFNGGLIGIGTSVFLTSYAMGIIYAASTGFKQQSGWVAAPVFGPFIAAAQRDFQCTASTPQQAEACQRETVSEAGAVAILAGIGMGHLVGASLLAAGFFDRSRVWVRSDLVSVNLQLGPRSGMLQLGGRF
jgi:hypothetical protein